MKIRPTSTLLLLSIATVQNAVATEPLTDSPPAVKDANSGSFSTIEEPPVFRATAEVKPPLSPGATRVGGTGSRMDVEAVEVPATVQVKKLDALRQRGAAQDLNAALYHFPGVNPVWRYGGFQQIRSRGFRAIVLNDGRRDDRAAIVNSHPQGGLWSLDRIEVLKGPAAVLYGYGSVGGVVNLVRKKPSDVASYDADFAQGTGRRTLAHLGATGPIDDGLQYRLDLGYSAEQNFRDHVMNRLEGTLTLAYSPAPTHQILLRVAANQDHYNNDSGVPTVEFKPNRRGVPNEIDLDRRFNTPQDFLDYQRLDLELAYTWRINEALEFRQRVAYTRDTYEYFSTEGLAFEPSLDSQQVDRTFYFYFHHHWFPVLSQSELAVDVTTGPVHHSALLAYEFNGMFGAYSDRASNIFDGSIPSLDLNESFDPAPEIPIRVDARLRADMRTHSVFVQDLLQLPGDVNLMLGGRMDMFSFKARRDALDPNDLSVQERGATDNRKDLVFSHRVGLVYRGLPSVSPYVSWSTAYKPNSGLGISTDLDGDGIPDFDRVPEGARQLDGGLRAAVDNISGTVSAFKIWKNNVTYGRPMGEVVTAGKVESHGLEVELKAQLLPGMLLQLGYAWTAANFKKFEVDGISLAGNVPTFVPEHSATGWLSYTANSGIGAGFGGRVTGEQFGDNENTVRLRSYFLSEAALWYQMGPLRLTINGTNLADRRRYYVSAIGQQLTPGVPRRFLAQARLEL